MRNILYICVLALLLGVTGCADQIVSECDVIEEATVTARFSEIEQHVFAQSCATAGCHAGSNPQAGLDLSPGKAYASLVGANSLNHPGEKLVEPGGSGQSVLIALLRRERQPVMPPAGSLDAAVIDSIAAWIDRGAPED